MKYLELNFTILAIYSYLQGVRFNIAACLDTFNVIPIIILTKLNVLSSVTDILWKYLNYTIFLSEIVMFDGKPCIVTV